MRSSSRLHKRSGFPLRTLVVYALPSRVTSVAALPMALFVPAFYADELGLPLAAVGAAIAVSRLLDVVTDPLIGSLSDRLGTRWGRRKPWMIAGIPLFLVAVWQVLVPGESASTAHLLVWSALLYLGFTMIDLPLALLREGDTGMLIVLIAVRGSSFASILFLANSMAADVIDVDTLASGEQRSGLYFAAWGMAIKLSLALGVLLGTALPAAFGYDPAAPETSPEVQTYLMLIYGCVPALLVATGVLFLRRFPITRERHAEVRAALNARSS